MPKPTVPADIRSAIRKLADQELSGVEIERELRQSPELRGRPLPALRTIQRLATEYRSAGRTTPPWSFARDNDHDAWRVLGVLGSVIVETHGRRTYLTNDEARWVKKLARVMGGIAADNPFALYSFAREYIRREQANAPTDDLDQWLAFLRYRPGNEQSQEAQVVHMDDDYRGAVEAGWVREVDLGRVTQDAADG